MKELIVLFMGCSVGFFAASIFYAGSAIDSRNTNVVGLSGDESDLDEAVKRAKADGETFTPGNDIYGESLFEDVPLKSNIIFKSSAVDSIDLELEYAQNMSDNTALVYSIELVKDNGDQVIEPMISSPALHSRGWTKKSMSIKELSLEEGYYMVRAKVLAEASGQNQLSMSRFYFRVENDDVYPVNAIEFDEKSAVAEGVRYE